MNRYAQRVAITLLIGGAICTFGIATANFNPDLASLSEAQWSMRGLCSSASHDCVVMCNQGNPSPECNNQIQECPGDPTEYCWQEDAPNNPTCQTFTKKLETRYDCATGSTYNGACGDEYEVVCNEEWKCTCSEAFFDECDCGPFYVDNTKVNIHGGCS